MKKKLGITIGALAGTAIIGWFGMQQTDAAQVEPKLSEEDVQQMVTDQYEGTITELELDKEWGKAVYEVEVHANGMEYDLKLDADTGEVIVEDQEKANHDDKVHPQESQSAAESNNKGSDGKGNSGADLINIERVKEIALNEFDGTITDLELDDDDGRFIYEIEVRNGEKEAEFEIDAQTEEILELDIDDEDGDD